MISPICMWSFIDYFVFCRERPGTHWRTWLPFLRLLASLFLASRPLQSYGPLNRSKVTTRQWIQITQYTIIRKKWSTDIQMAWTQCIHPPHPNIHSFKLPLSYPSLVPCIPTRVYCIVLGPFFFLHFQSCLSYSLGLICVFVFGLHSWLMCMPMPFLLLFVHKLMTSWWLVMDLLVRWHTNLIILNIQIGVRIFV
jgi:hypothetical protein